MRCPSCGADGPPGFAFCGYCGAPLAHSCPRCGFSNPGGATVCQRCGGSLSGWHDSSSRTGLEGERRFVAVLFADLAGFTRISEHLDPEEATWLVNRCLDEMSTVVLRYGGRIDKYIGDGLMAVFGAPVSHEDDPQRALLAALAMREQVANLRLGLRLLPLALHIGVSCGVVVAAEVGSQRRREYTVIGIPVNQAAHLEEASAPGQILVSEELRRLTEHAFEFRPVPPSEVQVTGNVRAFELLGERSGSAVPRGGGGRRTPLVGREVELAVLERCLARMSAEGRGQVIAVIGEAGIGKSRLVSEVRASTRRRGMGINWLEGQVPAHGDSLGYGLFADLLRSALGVRVHQEQRRVRARLQADLQALFGERWGEPYPYLARLLGLEIEEPWAEALQRLDGEGLKWQTLRAVEDFLTSLCARGPLALVVDSLHRADYASLEMLQPAVELTARQPLTIIALSRITPGWAISFVRERASALGDAAYIELRLNPLSDVASVELIRHLLGGGGLPSQAEKLLLTRGGGNPLFIEELLATMMERGLLVRRDGDWELTGNVEDVAMPETIQAILQARVDRLDDEARRLCQIAACVGARFTLDLLVGVASQVGLDADRVPAALNRLEEAVLIDGEGAWPEREFSFRHMLVREMVHGALLKEARAQYHAAIARWYEEHTLETASPPYALLAYHYEQAEVTEKQRLYLAKAGLQAAASYAHREARTFFSNALALNPGLDERFELLSARERSCDLLGDRAQQRADLEEMWIIAEKADDDRRRALVCNRLAACLESQGDYPSAQHAAEAGLEAAQRAGDRLAEAESLLTMASAAWRQGRFDAAFEAGQAALEVSRAAGDLPGVATALTSLGLTHAALGELSLARGCYEEALDIRRALGDRRGEAISLTHLANLFYEQGDYTAAFDDHHQALDLFRLVGDRRGEAWSLSGIGTVYLVCGQPEKARPSIEESLAIRRLVGDRRGEAMAMTDLGSALLAMGEVETACALLEQAVVLIRDLGARRDEVYVLTALAQALERAGRLKNAQAAHQAALSRRREQGRATVGVENLAGLGRVALAQGDLDTARAYAEAVLDGLREHGLQGISLPFLAYASSIRVLRACGEEAMADQVLAEARRLLMERAARIRDPLLRRSFLEGVPEHREIGGHRDAKTRRRGDAKTGRQDDAT